MQANYNQFTRKAIGFSLIEILLGMMVLSFGVVSFSAGQLYLLQSYRDSQYYLKATFWSAELQQRISLNPMMKQVYMNEGFWGLEGNVVVNCKSNLCDLQQLAMNDIQQLSHQLSGFPDAKIKVQSCHNNSLICIQLRWYANELKEICGKYCVETRLHK